VEQERSVQTFSTATEEFHIAERKYSRMTVDVEAFELLVGFV